MITCEKARDMISLYIDNLLDDEEKIEFEKHLDDCSRCKEDFNEVRQIISLITENSDEEDLPPDFGEKLHNRLMDEKCLKEKHNRFGFLRSRYIKVVATIAAVLVMAVIFKDLYTANLTGNVNLAKSQSTEAEYGNGSQAGAGGFSNGESANIQASEGTRKNDASDENTGGNLQDSANKEAPAKPEAENKESSKNTAYALKKEEAVKQEQPAADKDKLFVGDTKAADAAAATRAQPEASQSKSFMAEDTGESPVGESDSKMAVADNEKKDAAMFKVSGIPDSSVKREMKYTTILVATDSQKAALANIKTYLTANGAGFSQKSIQPAAVGIQSIQGTGEIILDSKLTPDQYEAFVSYLITYFGAPDVKIGSFTSVDIDKETEGLEKELDEINKNIEVLKNQESADEQKMNDLLNEQKNVQDEIDSVLKDTGSIYIQLRVD